MSRKVVETKWNVRWRSTVVLLKLEGHEPASIGEFNRAVAAFNDPTPARVARAIIEFRDEDAALRALGLPT